ncbi:hypothetical protein VTN49DRAFT_778 [Thermomyces lanuginosus]|uniref:uncharacterized protein n=1 Tax=Thermomyces lanuginosus TaxID=5541 RepID=UPI003742D216
MHGLLACSWRGHAIPHHMDDEISVSIDLFVDAMENKAHAEIMGRRALVDFLRGLGTGISKGPLRRGFVRSVRIMLLNHPPSGRSFRTSLPGHPKCSRESVLRIPSSSLPTGSVEDGSPIKAEGQLNK